MQTLQASSGRIDWRTHPSIKRHPDNPILTARDVPFRATLTFNAGVCKFQNQYVMIFRNDFGSAQSRTIEGTQLGLALSRDGIAWHVQPQPLNADPDHPLHGAYDPRLTVLDGRVYLCFAQAARVDGHAMDHGTCGGMAVTDDFEHWEVLSRSMPDNRNMVLFPERINGHMMRLERPFAGYLRPGDRFDTWISASPDGRFWGENKLLLTTERVPWARGKIGPGAPPIKTRLGWLAIFHGVDDDPVRKGWGWSKDWTKRYSAGLMLLDTRDPSKVIGLSNGPVLVPEARFDYEARGYRDYVLFPGGMILEDDQQVKIYYGAADTVQCLAIAHLDDLLALCEPLD